MALPARSTKVMRGSPLRSSGQVALTSFAQEAKAPVHCCAAAGCPPAETVKATAAQNAAWNLIPIRTSFPEISQSKA
jgi:hypothetical protein